MLVDMWMHLRRQISKHGTTASILSLATSLKKIEVPFGLRPILAFDLCQSNFGIWDPDKIE